MFGLCTVDLHAFNWGNGGLGGTGYTEKISDQNAFFFFAVIFKNKNKQLHLKEIVSNN